MINYISRKGPFLKIHTTYKQSVWTENWVDKIIDNSKSKYMGDFTITVQFSWVFSTFMNITNTHKTNSSKIFHKDYNFTEIFNRASQKTQKFKKLSAEKAKDSIRIYQWSFNSKTPVCIWWPLNYLLHNNIKSCA